MEPHPSPQSRLLSGALATLPALARFALSLLATRHGVGVSPDSVTYIDAARNLVAGNGLQALSWHGSSVPLAHYPPLYPAALAAEGALGLDIPAAARWLNAALFAASLLLVARIGQRLTRSVLFALLGCVLALSSTAMLRVQAMAWSESLFAL